MAQVQALQAVIQAAFLLLPLPPFAPPCAKPRTPGHRLVPWDPQPTMLGAYAIFKENICKAALQVAREFWVPVCMVAHSIKRQEGVREFWVSTRLPDVMPAFAGAD